MDAHMKRWKLFYVVFIYSLVFIGKRNTAMLSSPGDIMVVGMFEIFEPQVTQCGNTVKINSVMYAEAIRWYFKKLNETGTLPFTIGFDAYRTCQIDTLAAAEAVKLVNRVLQPPSGENPKLIAGVIGPEYSSESIAVSRVLGAIDSEYQLPQIGFSATAASLRDTRKYPNFISVVPDDEVQIEAIIQSMLQLEWNRVAIVYEDNVLGQEASAALTQRVAATGICIALTLPVEVKNGISVSSINEIRDSIIYGKGELPPINGYVFFGSASTVKVLFGSIKSSDIQTAPIALLSESIELDINTFKEGTVNVFSKTQGSLAVSPPYRAIDEFREYWISIFTDENVYNSAVIENPWLQHIATYINTTCEIQACSFPTTVQQMFQAQPLYVQYAIFAAHALAVGINNVHNEHCEPTEGICSKMASAFKPFQVADKLRDSVLNFETDFNFNMAEKSENGEVASQSQIGDFNDGQLTLNTSLIRDYPDGTGETRWPYTRKAQCGVKQECTECMPRDLPERFVHVPGDIYVVGLVPVYDRSATVECNTIRTINGYQLVEALKFAVEKANRKTGIFSNSFKSLRVGLIVLNTCNNEIVAQRILYELLKNGLNLPNGEHIYLENKIIGFVGDVGSSISIAIAEVLTRFRYVQVSYASASPFLSDRGAYPYFLRLTTPDDAQARVMVDVVKKLDGNYIQILYSRGAYGEGGMSSVLSAAEKNSVCVIATIEVVEENANYNSYYEQLRKNPDAKTVIVFVRSHVAKPLLAAMNQQIKRGEFIFIGSATWARNPDVLNDDKNQNLLGSFTVALELAHDAELLTYMTRIQPAGFHENPWVKLYLQSKLGCYYPDSFDKSKPKACNEVLDFQSDPHFSLTTWATSASNAVISLLIGAWNHIQTECGDVTQLCGDYMANIDGLIEELKKVELDIPGIGTRQRVFNDNGDGNVGYVLYNIQKDVNNPLKLVYRRVGQYPPQGEPTFSTGLIVSPVPGGVTSVCPSERACSSCLHLQPNTTTVQSKTDEQGPVTIVLGALFGVSVIVIIVLIVVIVVVIRKPPQKLRAEDPYYIHPIDLPPNFDRPPVPGAQLYEPEAKETFDYIHAGEINVEEHM